jgi:hypothetical protein
VVVGLILGGLILLAMTVLLALMLGVLSDSRSHIRDTDTKVQRLYRLSRPGLREAGPLADEARSALTQVQPFLRSISGSGPALRSFAGNAESLAADGSSFLRGGAAVFSEGGQILQSLQVANLAPAVLTAGHLLGELESGDRLVRALDATTSLAESASSLGLPSKAVRSSRRLKLLLDVQRRAYDVQRKNLQILQRSLEIQKRTLAHTRSIDEKTGGNLPVP